MRSHYPLFLMMVPAALLSAACALADTILLKNGSRLEGVVEKTEPGPRCKPCGGAGEVRCPACNAPPAAPACARCAGTGRVKCAACKGRGSGEGRHVIRLRGGARITIPEGDVVSIRKKDIPPEDLMPPRRSYAARVAKLAEDDAAGQLALAAWALGKGLLAEASKHARRAAGLDAALAEEARRVFQAADQKRVGAAAGDVTAALELVRKGRLAEGLAALDTALDDHAGNPLFSDPEREAAFLKMRASDVAARYGSTFEGIRRSLERRVKLACPKCSGVSASPCAGCAGSGAGTCKACAGTGETWCTECNGTKWRVCIRCGGTGKPAGFQFGVSASCPDCVGRGVVKCSRCKKGRVPCGACAGDGKIAHRCRACSGEGKIACARCLGTGLRAAALLRWGPAPEIEPGAVIAAGGPEAEGPFPVWQGLRRGCIVTAVRAVDLHEGALTEQLAVVTGERRELLLVCIDNRDGRDQVEFAPEEQGLRLVTGEARQVDALPPPDVKTLAAKHARLAAALEQLRPTAVLPGATADVIGLFPEGTDLAGAKAVYWGRRDPLRLARHYVSEKTMAAIRKTMR